MITKAKAYGITSRHQNGVKHCLTSTDSNLEAFRCNPADGSFAALAFQLTAFTNCLNEVFLSYSLRLLSQHQVHQWGETKLSHDGLNPAHVPCWRVNNPTFWNFCVSMTGRADIEGSKSNVAMNAWLPQASCQVWLKPDGVLIFLA